MLLVRPTRIVSGGQTGADRAALDAAIACGVDYGGWCPLDGWAEDHPQPPGLLAAYPALRPTPSPEPSERTVWNVRDSDATLVLVLREPGECSGTALTVRTAARLGRPNAVLSADDLAGLRSWLGDLGRLGVLNVAGPRESGQPGLYAAAYRTLGSLLSSLPDSPV